MTKEELNEIANEVAKQIIFCKKKLLSSTEVASYMGVSKSYIYKLTSQNRIPHYKPMGKVCYFDRLELENWLMSNRASSDDEISQKAQSYCTKKGGVI